MLEQLLSEIRQGGPLTTAILARRLNTSLAMVDAMLEQLVQFGYIQPVEAGCESSNCQDCSLTGLCQTNPSGVNRLWTLSR